MPYASKKMTDYYKISLEILLNLFKGAGIDHWENWIAKDIELWESEKNTSHHTGAFGGMGSINDLSVGGTDTIGVWKDKLFEITKTLSWSLAKGKVKTAPTEIGFYNYGSNVLSGWKCRKCGHAILDNTAIEFYLSTLVLPKIFVEFIIANKLSKIVDLNEIIERPEIERKRIEIQSLISSNGINFSEGNQWLWTCPKCESKDVCVYRWKIKDNGKTLIESDDNISQHTTMAIVNTGFWSKIKSLFN